jgi:hypothetical protein
MMTTAPDSQRNPPRGQDLRSMRSRRAHLLGVVTFLLAPLLLTGSSGAARGLPSGQNSEIDDFMEKVLEKREINWDELYDYVFSETVKLDFTGMEIAAIESFEHEYIWFVRDGYLVRSPYRLNGVEVSAEEKAEYENKWLADMREGGRDSRIERDSFFDFQFEPGNYFFAGREEFEGREVVKIEYYPENLFSDEEESGDEEEDEFERAFDKTSLVTMLIDPQEHQIVKITFDNIGLEFLPGRWLVQVDEIKASMIIDMPIEGVWLPRLIEASGRISTASGRLSLHFSREFYDYKQTEVGAKVKYGRPKIKG